jgi:hypothetical protein
MPSLLSKDNDKNGTVNEEDRNLNNNDVLSNFDTMTQNVYFRDDNDPLYPSNQTSQYGYNPKNEDLRYFTGINSTNWHEAFLMAENTVEGANVPTSALRDYNMVIMVTDGQPTVDDGANNKWDIFQKRPKPDENFDNNESNSLHASRAKSVIDSLRSGSDILTPSKTFAPVQVYGIMIGGGSAEKTRMNNTFGTGNWFASANFDSTLGAQLLNIVGNACPPDPNLTASMSGTIVSSPADAIEGTDVSYVVDITNTGSAALDEITVTNGTVIPILNDTTYSNDGLLGPGQKRRFSVTYHAGSGSRSTTVTIPYSAHVADDASLLVPGTPTTLSGQLTAGLGIKLIPRPA